MGLVCRLMFHLARALKLQIEDSTTNVAWYLKTNENLIVIATGEYIVHMNLFIFLFLCNCFYQLIMILVQVLLENINLHYWIIFPFHLIVNSLILFF